MIRGAILNIAAFTGNNYVAKYLSGEGQAVLDEKARDDNALQAYKAVKANYTRDGTKLLA